MIADARSPPPPNSAADQAFVMDSRPNALSFVDPFHGRRSPDLHRGLASFQGFLRRAGGGATSVYFFPFLSAAAAPPNDDWILRLIAQCCPNLKHLSFHGSNNASEEAILEVIHSCSKLELVDFSDTPYFEPTILQQLSIHCPNIRGIRRNGRLEPSFSWQLSVGFPLLRILNISNSTLVDKDLLTIVDCCRELSYLDVTGCQFLVFYMQLIKVASARIATILYD